MVDRGREPTADCTLPFTIGHGTCTGIILKMATVAITTLGRTVDRVCGVVFNVIEYYVKKIPTIRF